MNSSSSFSLSVQSGRKQRPTDLQWSGVFSVCGCNLQASMKTSLTYSNPGRRFFSCHRYSAGSKQPACNFFQWVDPPTCPRGHEILPTYIKKVKTMEEELRM
ncbi:hypothetical protein CJ030_MR7G009292 [Morella rubra]|uniref:GRF-type domain-containing protein n=1 Tax=Morella rubra TaxID=262757 RepID=A0A6A1V0A1_9ROSI|nr:hypothetical protein CJ030_MR7G009292 [Morella rubra]